MKQSDWRRMNFTGKKIYANPISEPKKKKTTRSETNYRKSTIFYLVCFFGCVHQITQVSVQYFSYPTVTNLRMYRADHIYPPSVSLCFPYFSMVNFTLALKEPSINNYAKNLSNYLNLTIDFSTYQMKQYNINEFDRQFSAYLAEHFSIAKIMNMTNRIEDWITRCVVVNPKDYVTIISYSYLDCLEVLNFRSYIKNDLKCFEIFFKSQNLTRNSQISAERDRNYIYNFERLAINYIWNEYIWYMQLNSTLVGTNTEYITIYLHPYYRKPGRLTDTSISYRSPGRNHTLSISWAWTRNILLPKPYRSNCTNYSKGRDYEVNECVLKNSLAKYNKVPLAATLPSECQAKSFSFSDLAANESLYKQLENLIFNCHTLQPERDCILEIYQPILRSLYEGGVAFEIELFFPMAEDLENLLIPYLTLLDYMIFSGSVLGIWFGLSIIRLPFIISVTLPTWFRNIFKVHKITTSMTGKTRLFQYKFRY